MSNNQMTRMKNVSLFIDCLLENSPRLFSFELICEECLFKGKKRREGNKKKERELWQTEANSHRLYTIC